MSSLVNQIKQKFAAQPCQVVSFDLFDTLIFRKVARPTEIFALAFSSVERKLNLPIEANEFEQLRIKAEQNVKKDTSEHEVSLEEIYSYLPFSEEQKQLLITAELSVERDNSFLFKPVLSLINWLSEQQVQVLFLSDMYLSKEQIHQHFFHQAAQLKEIPLYVSSQYKVNKSTGKMFDFVRQKRELNFSDWMHIGDNKHSDFMVPQRLGIHAIHASSHLDFEQIIKTEALINRHNIECNAVRHLAMTHKNQMLSNSAERASYEIAAGIWGPALLAFADWVIDKSIRVKCQTILCLMREAEVFAPLIRIRLQQRAIQNIQVKKVFVSRKSTFWPSIDTSVAPQVWIKQLIQLLIVPRGYRVSDFYADFQLAKNGLYEKYQDTLIKNTDGLFHNGENLLNSLTNLAVNNAAQVKRFIDTQRAKFLNYYQSEVGVKYSECVVVDLGNGGTIQSQLQRIFNQACAANLLFYSSRRIHRYAQDVVYASYLDESLEISKLLSRSPECIETFLVGDCGTTLTYADDEHSSPVLASKLHENSSLVIAFMRGLKDYFNYHQQLGYLGISVAEVKVILKRFINYPTQQEAALFTQVYHQDNFGSDYSYPVVSKEQLEFVKEYGLEQVFLESSRYTRWKVGHLHWPQALLNLSSDKFMQKHHGLVSMDTDNDVAELVERIKNSGWKSFSIYGAGEFFTKLLPYIVKNDWQVERVIDRQAEITGPYEQAGHMVLPLNQALEIGCKKMVICSMRFKQEIAKNVYQLAQQYQSADIELLSL